MVKTFDVIILNIEFKNNVLQIASNYNYGDAYFANLASAKKFIEMSKLVVQNPDNNFEFKEFNHMQLLKTLASQGFTAQHSALVSWDHWVLKQCIWRREAS